MPRRSQRRLGRKVSAGQRYREIELLCNPAKSIGSALRAPPTGPHAAKLRAIQAFLERERDAEDRSTQEQPPWDGYVVELETTDWHSRQRFAVDLANTMIGPIRADPGGVFSDPGPRVLWEQAHLFYNYIASAFYGTSYDERSDPAVLRAVHAFAWTYIRARLCIAYWPDRPMKPRFPAHSRRWARLPPDLDCFYKCAYSSDTHNGGCAFPFEFVRRA